MSGLPVNREYMLVGVNLNAWSAILFCVAGVAGTAIGQQNSDSLRQVSHSSSLVFMERDGTCIDGPVSKLSAKTITVQPNGKSMVTIKRADLLQISQGDALLFTATNTWSNIEQAAAHVYPREAFALKLKNGKLVTGKPIKVTPDTVSLKHGFVTSLYKENEIETVDYLRLKPESDSFDYFSRESPVLLFFDPEFYYRAVGLEGRLPVRLYDSAKPLTSAAPQCL